MEKEPKMGIDPKLKKEINKEGWEEDAAVLIGKKEEMEQLEKRLEEEGRAANLGTYLKMHKIVMVPREEMEKISQTTLNPGLAYFHGGDTLYYIDKNGSIVCVEIEHEKIASYSEELGPSSTIRELVDELKELGFKISAMHEPSWFDTVVKEIAKYKEKIEREMAEKKKEEFDF